MNTFLEHLEQVARLFTLTLFALGILVCVFGNFPLLYALAFGLICFTLHARSTGITWSEILRLLLAGIKRVRNLIVIFIFIGMLTGVWRVSGTIPFLLVQSLSVVNPDFFFLWCFLICAGLSWLLGTALGTVSTLGVICMLMAKATGVNEILTGGAILSGIYVGDRCSPMSSSAALVCAITRTTLYDNLYAMFRSSFFPLLLTCAAYAALSPMFPILAVEFSPVAMLREHFPYSFLTVLPALSVLLLGVLRVDVKISALVSILFAVAASIFTQHAVPSALVSSLLFGYNDPRPELTFLNGGGIKSMAVAIGIVLLSSSYSLLIERSRLLEDFRHMHAALSLRLGSYPSTVITSFCTAALACNQTLAILLTQQLCAPTEPDKRRLALFLEDSVVLISPLLPWNIAFSLAAVTIQQGHDIIPFAFYLWMLPLYRLLRCFFERPGQTHEN